MKKLILILALVSPALYAQPSCTLATCTAVSPNQSDFLAALPSSGNTNSTVTVNIPSGTASWTSTISYAVPSAVTTLIIQGNTTVTCTGTGGQSSYACAAADNTIIEMNYATFGPMLNLTTNSSATSLLRITGITWEEGSVTIGQEPIIGIGGNGQIRWDHNHVNSTTGSGVGGTWVINYGNTTGVADHNLWDLSTCNGFPSPTCPNPGTNAWGAFNDIGDTSGSLGDGTYNNPTQWGSSQAIYFENNVYNGGASNDCYRAGFYVSRYNTMNDEYIPIQTHGTKSSGGPWRGCRGYEAYHNYITGPGGSQTGSGASGSKAGPAMVWGNTLANAAYYQFWEAATDRNGGDSAAEVNPPNGWGYCGTTVTNPSTGNPNGVGSAWDGNQPTITTGYPCLDGLGRGQTQQLMNNQVFPNRLNSATGTIAWPQQYLEPVYLWNNSVGTANYVLIQDLVTKNNRDYYYDQTAQSGSFTGAAGTGTGLLSARPTSCTAGPGGPYATSPGGESYGVGYFATDTNTLSVCIQSGNPGVWKNIYTPYTYPHPLVGGVTTYVLTTATSGSGTGTISGCAGNYAASAPYSCSVTATGGSTLTSVTGCGGSGTTTYAGTMPANACTVTATFTGGTPVAATPVISPQSGNYGRAQTATITDATAGATIHYTVDGTTPTTSSAVYSTPLNISSSTNIQAIATAAGFLQSATGQSIIDITSAIAVDSHCIAESNSNASCAPGQVFLHDTVVVLASDGNSCLGAPTDGVNTYNLVIAGADSANPSKAYIWVACNAAAGTPTVTLNGACGSNEWTNLHVFVLANTSTASTCWDTGPITQTLTNLSGSSTLSSGSPQLPSGNNEWVEGYAIPGVTTTTTATAGANYTIFDPLFVYQPAVPEYWLQTTATATNTPMTTTTAFDWVMVATAILPAGGATPACATPFQTGPNFSGTYNVPPYTLPLSVGFTSSTPGCTMHYTITAGNTTPAATCSSSTYSGSSSLSVTTTISVVACQAGFTSSSTSGGTWTIVGGGLVPGAPSLSVFIP